MAYHVLARKWRPGKFADLVGQEHVVSAISNALDNNRLHHAYLFTGTRGVGKTTIARIFAKSLNCEKGMTSEPCGVCGNCQDIEAGRFVDLLEIDAASRTKVEDTRELLDNVQYKPTRGDYKVYLIDEVHMLSKHSFNALLKTLEEPPPHIKFLLATTDPQKLPITILSRCLQFNLKALTREQIATQLQYVLSEERIQHENQALSEIAKSAQGSMRDALSLTDQAIAQGNGNVSTQVVADMLGLMDRNQVLKLLHAVLAKEKKQVFGLVEELAAQAPDFSQLMSEMQALLHQVALTQYVPEACKLEGSSAKAIYYLAGKIPPEMVQLQYQILLQGRKDLPYAVDARSGLEMTLLRMLAFTPQENQDALSDFPISDGAAEKKTLNFITEYEPGDSQINSDTIAGIRGTETEAITKKAAESAPKDPSATKESDSQDIPILESNDTELRMSSGGESHGGAVEEAPEVIEGIDPKEVRLQQEASEIMEQAEQLRGIRHTEPENTGVPQESSVVAEQFAEAIDADSALIEGETRTDALHRQHSDPYFHPEDLNQYDPQEDSSGSHMDDLQQLSSMNDVNPSVVPATPEDESEGILDTKALLDIHSSLQNVVATDSAEGQSQKELLSPEGNDPDPEEAVPANPFRMRAAALAEAQKDVEETQPQSDVSPAFEDDDNPNEPVDFDVPLQLDGQKVVAARQLDTWSQLIEQTGLSGLPKQLVLHSNYLKEGTQVKLILNPEKQHLVSDASRQTIAEALSQVLQQQVNVVIETGEVKDTPYSVQKAINKMRLIHAKDVIKQDPNIQLMQQQFAASVIEESIKPR